MKAQGNALGEDERNEPQALKGRHLIVPPLQGLLLHGYPNPRALPWAVLFGPFRAERLHSAKVLPILHFSL